MSAGGRIGRRGLLVGGLALAATAGCGILPSVAPPPSRRPPVTLADLVADDPFYIAHRGGGANWPEMTAFAYSQAAALPYVKAIEISVCRSRDGVLVCSHDASTRRVTGVDHLVSQTDWATLAGLQVTAQFTDDPAQPARPFTRFDEVAEAHLPYLVAFIEPKTPDALEPLLARLVELDQPERTVWKQPVNQPNFARAKQHGFGTWGYVLDEPGHLGERLPRFAADPSIDMLGIEKSQPEEVADRVIGLARQNGKATVMWAITKVAERNRALALGCRGMMTSNIRDVPQA